MKGIGQKDILQGNIAQGIMKLALPLMFLNFINTFYNIVDTFWVGRIGELQVGAVSLIAPVMNCGIAFATGLSAAGISMIARALGAQERNRANEIATHCIEICLMLGVVIGILCVVLAKPILMWLNTPAEIFQDSYWYLIGISLDFLFLFVLTLFQSIRQSNGDSSTGVKINTIAAILNMILDPLFIFGLNWGVFGAALATTVSKGVMVPVALYILKHDAEAVTVSFKQYRFNPNLGKAILKVALPASAGQFLSAFGFVLMNKNIIAYGSIAMSAYGIGNKISSLFYIPVNGIGGALATFIGQNLGADNPLRAKECFQKAMFQMIQIAVAVTMLGFLCARFCVLIFVANASKELLAMASEYAYYSIATAIFMGWYNNLAGVFEGSGNTKVTLFLSVLRLWGCRIPLIYLFGQLTSLGPVGIWWAMVISNVVVCVVGQALYWRYPWSSNGVRL